MTDGATKYRIKYSRAGQELEDTFDAVMTCLPLIKFPVRVGTEACAFLFASR
jgi:phospholipid N-methyltransferase